MLFQGLQFQDDSYANVYLNRLKSIDGDWHEFESKALRKENERRDREARKASKDAAAASRARDKKRSHDSIDQSRDPKRIHVDAMTDDAAPVTAVENVPGRSNLEER
jgi:hypothetical protein